MGHVSDFNGMNTSDEGDLNQAASDLISANNILDSLNENFMPIYNSFPDDIYRHPNLYASSNLTSFANTDDDRNGYFDEPLELDLFLDSDNFNFDFDASEPVLENEQQVLQNDPINDFNLEGNIRESSGNIVNFKQENEPDVPELRTCINETISQSDVNSQENDYTDNFETTGPSEPKTYTAETVFQNSDSSDVKSEEIPKIIIRLKPESKCTDFTTAEVSAPLTIADNVKLGRRKNGNVKCDDSGQTLATDVNKRKSHKKKSRHKKRHKELKGEINQNTKLPNCNTASFPVDNILLNSNKIVNTEYKDFKAFENSSQFKNGLNYQLSNDNNISFIKSSLVLDKDLSALNSDHVMNNSISPVNSETVEKTENERSVEADDTFQFDFETANSVSLSLSSDDKVDTSVEDFLEHINITFDHGNIPDLSKSLVEEAECVKSVETLSPSDIEREEFHSPIQTENSVAKQEPSKSSSVSELIEELNAHNQQVFEEIEISTPELELELHANNSTKTHHESSHQSENSANNSVEGQSKTATEHGENDMNSQNHLCSSKTSLSAQTTLAFHSTINNHSVTAQPRNISSSCNSTTSRSSSHRSYRKRRRSSSSSSSSSEKEKFYNRPVKYDPVTQTYCDEFGREIRPNELKYYLDAKSSRPHDSHSNNGSSSSSRSKSPRYRSYHRKHHKSRSGSRSHRRRKYSSSRSRSRSPSRKYKVDNDRRYRSPSPNHRSKRHYLDVEENMRAYEERRVMYVGDIPPDYTVEQLKDRFSRFGPIQAASIKSKITTDGSLYIFGFVTFKNRSDVCQAIERGNDNPSWPRFDLNFGGRRRFCNGNYTDLDGKVAEAESGWYSHKNFYRQQPSQEEDDFAELLRQEQRRLGMSKK